jgi:hypothetical protein
MMQDGNTKICTKAKKYLNKQYQPSKQPEEAVSTLLRILSSFAGGCVQFKEGL